MSETDLLDVVRKNEVLSGKISRSSPISTHSTKKYLKNFLWEESLWELSGDLKKHEPNTVLVSRLKRLYYCEPFRAIEAPFCCVYLTPQ